MTGVRGRELVEARIRAQVEYFIDLFDLGWLKVKIAFDPRADGDRVACETISDWEYRQASFIWNLPTVVALEDDDLDGIIIHEIVHALIAPLYKSLSATQQEKLHDVNELSTENVCRVIEFLLANELSGDNEE